jgi:hypothetical protein
MYTGECGSYRRAGLFLHVHGALRHVPPELPTDTTGAWVIHPVLIIGAKLLIDAIPGIRQELSWTIVNLGYMLLSFVMFHHVTGVPFETA